MNKSPYETDSDLFTGWIAQSAPQPREGFQEELGARLDTELQNRSRPPGGFLRIKSRRMRWVAIVAALLLIAGSAFAVSSLIQSLIEVDAGLAYVYDADLGVELDQSQTIDDYTVTLEWAYADGERLTVAYTITGLADIAYTNLETASMEMIWKGDSDVELPGVMGMGNMLNGTDGLTGSVSGNRMTFDLSNADIDVPVLDLHMELGIHAVTVLRRTEIPDLSDFQALWDVPIKPFVFDFSVPYVNDVRLLNQPQNVTDQDITLTLEKVVITPSQVSVTVCYDVPDPARSWTSIPWLMADGKAVPGGGGVMPFIQGQSHTCDDFIYSAAMMDYSGTWELTITELVGFGETGNDQQRIAGNWAFEFTVP